MAYVKHDDRNEGQAPDVTPVSQLASKHVSHFDVLEDVLDQSNITQVVLMLARICNEKAEHVRSNWQDEHLARTWEFNANKLGTIAEKLRRTF